MPGVKRARDEDQVSEDHQTASSDIHPSRKRRLEYGKEHAKLAKLYDELADNAHGVRLKAATELIRSLSQDDKDRAEHVSAATTRLMKGLCSSRKAARIGFSVALAEVLRLAFDYRPDSFQADDFVRDLINKAVALTQCEGNASGQEKRDHMLGRRYAFQSLLQSGIMFRSDVEPTAWTHYLDLVLDLALEKQWLRRECGLMLFEFLVSQASEALRTDQVQAVVDGLDARALSKTPEGVALWLTIDQRFPAVSLPKGVWHKKDPLSPKELSTLAKVLRDGSIDEAKDASRGAKSKQPGAPQTIPGFAWSVILNHLYKNEKDSTFGNFWDQAVVAGLFAQSASNERKSLGLQVLTLAVATAPHTLLKMSLSPDILRCIANQRADAERYLFEAAKVPLNNMVNRVKIEPSTAGTFLKGLLDGTGLVNFDQATKTKTVDGLIAHADGDALIAVVQVIDELVTNPKASREAQVDAKRRSLAGLYLNLVRSRRETKDNPSGGIGGSWVESLVQILVARGYFEHVSGRHDISAISEASRQTFRLRLMSCLRHILESGSDKEIIYPTLAATMISDMSGSSHPNLLLHSAESVPKIVSTANERLDSIKKRASSESGPSKTGLLAFKLLYAMSILQFYNEEPDSVSLLEDLDVCYMSWQQGNRGDDTDQSFSMLIELLLSFASKPSAMFRRLAEQVFSAFAANITSDGLQSMVDILGQKESLSGQQELFDQQDDTIDGVEDVEERSDVEDASDVEIVNGNIVGTSDADDDNDSDVELGSEAAKSAESGASDDDNNEELAAFDAKLAEALGTTDDNSESDGSDMDDEEMFARDNMLTTIFKERQNGASKKQENKDAKENIVNFKNRVLDLLNIYVKIQFASVQALDLIMPLVTLVRTSTSKQVAEKAFGVLKQYFEACNKHKSLPQPEDVEAVFELLGSTHDEMKLGGSKLHANACSRASLFLCKVLINQDSKHYDRLAQAYTDLQKERWYDPKSKIQSSVFTEWTSWYISLTTRQ